MTFQPIPLVGICCFARVITQPAWRGFKLWGEAVRRRDFTKVIAGSAAAWPLLALAQQATKRSSIGFLGTATSAAWSQWTAAFVRRLHELGWSEGANLVTEYRWADGRSERIEELASDLVHKNVDVIVTSGTGVAATKKVTSNVPIVFAIAVDAVGSGFASSLAHPGGNVTGLSIQSRDLIGKRIELLREISPTLRRVGILGNGDYPVVVAEMRCGHRYWSAWPRSDSGENFAN